MQDSELLNVYTAKEAIVGSSIVSFDDGADDAPIKSLLANIKPVQDLHGYSKPWAGGAGKNMYSPSWAASTGAGSSVTADGEEIHVATTGGTTYSGMTSPAGHDLPAGTYYVKFKVKTGAVTGTAGLCGLRKRSNNTFAVTSSFSSGTLEYSFSGTTTEACYFSVLGNGGSTGDSQASDFTLYDIIISTENVDYEPYSNICPITGRTSAKICGFGKNLFNKNGVYSADVTITQNSSGFRIVSNANGTYKSCYGGFQFQTLDLPDGTEVTFSAHCKVNSGKARIGIRRESDNTLVAYSNLVSSGESDLSLTYTYDKSTHVYLSAFCTWSTSEAGDVEYTNVQLEIGSTKTDFVPYAGTTYTANWASVAGTVYGGSFDAVTGALSSAMANIASYNGETIGEPWLSSLDEYAPGGTPTTGAQVVYTLATPITYQLTPVQIRTISGKNNVWTDVGEIASLEYFVEQNKSFIDRLFVEGIDLQEKGWFLKWRKLSAPKPKSDYVSVFARDGDIDLTETEGQVFYEDRAIAMDMVYVGDEWEKDYSELLGLVHGQRLRVQFANDPSWYWSARLVAEIYEKKPHSLKMNGLAFPYKFDIVKTSASATVSGATEGTATTITLKATRMPVSPKVTVTGTVTLKWGSATKQLSAGTYYVDGLKVGRDGLSVKVWGTGTATFEYRRGAL